MTIYEQAINTYKAIHGTEPTYTPYYDASHTPFKGIDPELVKELVNVREVNTYLKEWRKENQNKGDFTHDNRDQFQYITWHRKKLVLLPYTLEVTEGEDILASAYDVIGYDSFHSSIYKVYNILAEVKLMKYRFPEPGEADKVKDLFVFKSKEIQHMVAAREPINIGMVRDNNKIVRISHIEDANYNTLTVKAKVEDRYGYEFIPFGQIVDL